MARLLTAGFETGTNQELNGAELLTSVVTTAARTGARSLAINCGPVNGATGYLGHVFDANVEEGYFRVALMIPDGAIAYSGNTLVFYDEAGDEQLTLRWDGNIQEFRLYRGAYDLLHPELAVLLATGTHVLRANIWYVIQGHFDIADSGSFELKINNVTDIAYSGDTKATAATGARAIRFAGNVGAPSVDMYVDDVAFNDTSGSYQNTWIGLGGVYFLKPNAEGAVQDWAPNVGTVHWSTVDEVPANTTDWVQSSTSAGDKELFNVEPPPEYVASVDVVNVIFQAAIIESGSQAVADVLRQGTTDYVGGTVTVVSITPDWVFYTGRTHYVQPSGAGAWGTADLDTAQVGLVTC